MSEPYKNIYDQKVLVVGNDEETISSFQSLLGFMQIGSHRATSEQLADYDRAQLSDLLAIFCLGSDQGSDFFSATK